MEEGEQVMPDRDYDRMREQLNAGAEKMATGNTQETDPAMGLAGMTAQGAPYSLRKQAEHNEYHYREKASQASAVVAFLRLHPEFEEFVHLIRSGAIQL